MLTTRHRADLNRSKQIRRLPLLGPACRQTSISIISRWGRRRPAPARSRRCPSIRLDRLMPPPRARPGSCATVSARPPRPPCSPAPHPTPPAASPAAPPCTPCRRARPVLRRPNPARSRRHPPRARRRRVRQAAALVVFACAPIRRARGAAGRELVSAAVFARPSRRRVRRRPTLARSRRRPPIRLDHLRPPPRARPGCHATASAGAPIPRAREAAH